MPKIYQELRRGFQARGAEVVLRRREARVLQDLPQGADFHFVHNGGGTGACVLNTAVAYLLPYFYFDPEGSIFKAAAIAPALIPKPSLRSQPRAAFRPCASAMFCRA